MYRESMGVVAGTTVEVHFGLLPYSEGFVIGG